MRSGSAPLGKGVAGHVDAMTGRRHLHRAPEQAAAALEPLDQLSAGLGVEAHYRFRSHHVKVGQPPVVDLIGQGRMGEVA